MQRPNCRRTGERLWAGPTHFFFLIKKAQLVGCAFDNNVG